MRPTFLIRGFFVSILFGLIPFSFQLRAQEYEVEGTIQEHIIQPGRPDWTTTATFKVYVRDCAWLIETVETNSSGKTKQRRIGSMNGQEIFQIIPAPKNASRAAVASPSGRRFVQVDGGEVVSNNIPIGSANDSIIPHLWVMFASQCYFKSQNATNRLMPAFDVDPVLVEMVDIRMDAEWELMSGKIPLPRKVVYFNDGGFYTMNTNKVLKFQNYGPPYKWGFTNSIYSVTAMTNFGGIIFPAGFTFADYEPGGGPTRYQVQARKTAEAVVTAFRPKCSRKDLLPEIQGVTLVRDMRLAHATPQVKSFGYRFQKGNHWLPVAEARKLSLVMPHQEYTSIARAVFFALLILPSVAFVYFLTKSKRK